ncbi:hypothetical protein JCGZ_19563 [Jatropha curcas]|uniref:Uncharacterized protein n=1 Tax=Jatropha curcas TaxID=180498 RepID=A0A067JUM9_JATCU|nr:hypothetical protein JCGZ_19563 [Jatropha curcas]
MAQTSGTERVFRSMCFGGRHGYIKLEEWVEVGRKARTVQGQVDFPRHEDVPGFEWGRMLWTNSVTVQGQH